MARPIPSRSGHAVDAILENLILQTLLEGPAHGYGIAERIVRAGVTVLESDEGAIYPALYRLLDGGSIVATRGGSGEGGAPRVYTLTESGRSRAERGRS